MKPEKINAPFTAAQVAGLKAWQACDWVHEFTCCDHVTMDVTADGFICPRCRRVQTWAHACMVAGPPPDPFAHIRELAGEAGCGYPPRPMSRRNKIWCGLMLLGMALALAMPARLWTAALVQFLACWFSLAYKLFKKR